MTDIQFSEWLRTVWLPNQKKLLIESNARWEEYKSKAGDRREAGRPATEA